MTINFSIAIYKRMFKQELIHMSRKVKKYAYNTILNTVEMYIKEAAANLF